jgi:hypothetical protein
MHLHHQGALPMYELPDELILEVLERLLPSELAAKALVDRRSYNIIYGHSQSTKLWETATQNLADRVPKSHVVDYVKRMRSATPGVVIRGAINYTRGRIEHTNRMEDYDHLANLLENVAGKSADPEDLSRIIECGNALNRRGTRMDPVPFLPARIYAACAPYATIGQVARIVELTKQIPDSRDQKTVDIAVLTSQGKKLDRQLLDSIYDRVRTVGKQGERSGAYAKSYVPYATDAQNTEMISDSVGRFDRWEVHPACAQRATPDGCKKILAALHADDKEKPIFDALLANQGRDQRQAMLDYAAPKNRPGLDERRLKLLDGLCSTATTEECTEMRRRVTREAVPNAARRSQILSRLVRNAEQNELDQLRAISYAISKSLNGHPLSNALMAKARNAARPYQPTSYGRGRGGR